MDSEALENSLHETFREIFEVVFGSSYVAHQVHTSFQNSIFRAMNTAEISLILRVNKTNLAVSSEGELTSNSWMTYIRSIFNKDVFCTGVQIVSTNEHYVDIHISVVCSKSDHEEVMVSVANFHEEIMRKAYDKNFNIDLENVLDAKHS